MHFLKTGIINQEGWSERHDGAKFRMFDSTSVEPYVCTHVRGVSLEAYLTFN